MPNDIAVLPPCPDTPGRYWMKPRWGDDIVARWNPSGRYWNAWEFSVLTAKHAAVLGYTLASPHPIPSAAALERLYAAWEAIQARTERMNSRLVSDEMDVGELSGLVYAEDLLRAALEDKP